MANILKPQKVRNELRFYSNEERYCYFDFSDGTVYGYAGEPVDSLPQGMNATFKYYLIDNPDELDSTLQSLVNLMAAFVGFDWIEEKRSYYKSWACYGHYHNDIEGMSEPIFLLKVYESLINLGYRLSFHTNSYDFGISFPAVMGGSINNATTPNKIVKILVKIVKELDAKDKISTPSDFKALYLKYEKEQRNKVLYCDWMNDFERQTAVDLNNEIDYNDLDKSMHRVYSDIVKIVHNTCIEAAINIGIIDSYTFRRKLVNCLNMLTDMKSNYVDTRKDFFSEYLRIEETHKLWKAQKDAEKLKECHLELYQYEDDTYFIYTPTCAQDLIYCGEELDNCVGRFGYWEKMLNKNCAIVFVRSKNEPEKNKFCVEIQKNYSNSIEFYQFLGRHNRTPHGSAIKEFQQSYYEYLNSKPHETYPLEFQW